MTKKASKGDNASEKLMQLSVRVPRGLHKALKLRSVEEGRPLRALLVDIISKAVDWSA